MTSDSSESSFVDSLSGSTSSEDSDVEEQQQLKGKCSSSCERMYTKVSPIQLKFVPPLLPLLEPFNDNFGFEGEEGRGPGLEQHIHFRISITGDNAQRQQLIRLLESQSVQIQRNVKHGKQLQHELDEVDCLTLLESIELTQHQVLH